MPHVRAGSIAKGSRRASAYERLGKHLDSHKNAHAIVDGANKEVIAMFESHDKCQKEEYKHIGELVNGTHS